MKCMAYGEVRRNKAEKEKADKEAAKQQILDDITATVVATAELIRLQEEVAETARRNKEEEERRQMEIEEKEKADKLAAEQQILDDITTTVIASVVLEAIRLEDVTRKEREDAELATALLEEEEAKVADEARRLAAETAKSELLDIPVEVSAEHAEETPVGEGVVSLVPFLPTILRPEQYTSSQATSSVVAELKGFMTQVAVNIEKNVNMVFNALEERKAKEVYYDSSLATLFDLVQKGEEDRRKEREERRKMESERLAREEKEREERKKLEEERLAREAEYEVRRQQQFAEMLR